jgi:enoyl-CoA hydratase
VSAHEPQELAELFARRASAGDLEGLLALYEDEATFVGPDGDRAAGLTAIRNRLAQLLAARPTISPLGSPQVVLAGDVALISARWRLTGGAGGPEWAVEGRSSEVVRRQPDGSWRYLVDHPVVDSLAAASGPPATPDPIEPEPPGFEQLRYEQDGPVARITLDRPQVHNALSLQLSAELIAALEHVQGSQTLKLLVICGAGETFCSGDDISEMPAWGDADQVMRRVRRYQQMANLLEELDKLTVAAVDGFAVGGGLELTMACDFVIATRRARWGMPEVDVGITPGWGGTTRMARLIGRRMTKEVNLLGALHPASRAVELGLWNRVVEHEQLEQATRALVSLLLSKNQQALRQLKFIINRGVEADQYTAQGFEAISAGLTGALSGGWQVPDGDAGRGVLGFATKAEPWRTRRALARDFWTDVSTTYPSDA